MTCLPMVKGRVLDRCSVFRGRIRPRRCSSRHPASDDDIAMLDVLDALVRKSLLVADHFLGAHSVFRWLETIRQFAEEQTRGERWRPKRFVPLMPHHFAGKESDILALWDSPPPAGRPTTGSLSNCPICVSAFRWAADQGDLNVRRPHRNICGRGFGFLTENHEPIAWARRAHRAGPRHRPPPGSTALYVVGVELLHGRTDRSWYSATPEGPPRRRSAVGSDQVPVRGPKASLAVAYVAVGQPERWIRWCRASSSRAVWTPHAFRYSEPGRRTVSLLVPLTMRWRPRTV